MNVTVGGALRLDVHMLEHRFQKFPLNKFLASSKEMPLNKVSALFQIKFDSLTCQNTLFIANQHF